MPNIQNFHITSYRVVLERSVLSHGGNRYNRLALINCLGPNQATDLVKFTNINFIKDEDGLPPNSTRPVGTQYIVTMYHPASCYAWYLDLLRNEDTTFLNFSLDAPQYNRIQTTNEPIGEGE